MIEKRREGGEWPISNVIVYVTNMILQGDKGRQLINVIQGRTWKKSELPSNLQYSNQPSPIKPEHLVPYFLAVGILITSE
jgi:hypothetical protein